MDDPGTISRFRISPILYGLVGVAIAFLAMMLVRHSLRSDTISPIVSPPIKRPLEIRGSIPYWDQQRAFTSLRTHRNLIDHVSLFWYYLNEAGDIIRYEYAQEDRSLIDVARASHISVTIVITNLPEDEGTTWDSRRVEHVLADADLRAYHIRNIMEKLDQLGVDGVTIDYEEVAGSARDNFSLFIKELSQALHEKGKVIAVALHPKTGEGSDTRYDFQDWKTLAQYADQLLIMAYGEHWDSGSSGPIASVSWVTRIIAYAQNQDLPNEKLFLGIPLYGYDWEGESERKATDVTYNDVQQLLTDHGVSTQWDESSRAPYFRYEKDGKTHDVWFENARSVREKILLAEQAGFAGVTFWRLGEEDPSVWEEVRLVKESAVIKE